MDDALETLLRDQSRLWKGRSGSSTRPGLATGYADLDAELPGGGWPPHALTEILLAQYGSGELRLLMPALARLSQPDDAAPPGWIAWVAPPFQPYAPALVQWGVDISRVLVVRPAAAADTLWAAEQALASGNCAAVLFWTAVLDDAGSRRLQLAAERGRSWAVAFRPPDAAARPSAAALRIRLQPGPQGTELHILKSRGGRPVTLHDLVSPHAGT